HFGVGAIRPGGAVGTATPPAGGDGDPAGHQAHGHGHSDGDQGVGGRRHQGGVHQWTVPAAPGSPRPVPTPPTSTRGGGTGMAGPSLRSGSSSRSDSSAPDWPSVSSGTSTGAVATGDSASASASPSIGAAGRASSASVAGRAGGTLCLTTLDEPPGAIVTP